MCHANIPLGSHDIAVKGEREEEWTINPTHKKGGGGEVEGWTRVSKHCNVALLGHGQDTMNFLVISSIPGSSEKRLTGKGGKLNTSQTEPVAANSWAVGQFPSISCEAFH